MEKDINTMGENPIQSEAEAWLGILYTCIKADHYISEAERKSLSRILYSKEKFKNVDFGPYYETAIALYKELGQLKYIKACCSWIETEDKETLFALALDVLLADGTLEKEEKSLIEILSNHLGVSTSMSSKIIEVMFLKNRGNIKV
ncbi:tellurite resistance TerB family protein [Flavobacterium tiangeerense]|uniref:tellurite resistance TerB family protein n=1 Tax=Flavobacterium tiangeerense TaxID=459471 RepID=UPI0011A2B642|nr:tellurite resistance TerB family protein [Flavobacterium tiangeerense]